MSEAKYSTDLRYTIAGIEEQLTVRGDTDLPSHFAEVQKARMMLTAIGASSKGNNGNGAKSSTTPPPAPPTCVKCKTAEHMEQITFTKEGQERKEWKCQNCGKWHYDNPPKK